MKSSKDTQQLTPDTIDRRQLLLGGMALAVTSLAGMAQAGQHDGHEGHRGDHADSAGAPKNGPLVAAALDCVGTGEACAQHCLTLLSAGDTSIAACMATVQQMLPVCATLASLAALGSPHLAAYARVCADICKDCEAECRKHEKHHAACKACAESCAKCITACNMVAA